MPEVDIRIPSQRFRLTAPGEGNSLARAAMEWTYTVRSRQRWSTVPDAADQQGHEAAELLGTFGIKESELAAIARADVVEVSTPWKGQETGWEARIFPWEFVLAVATRGLRGGAPFTVMRHLRRRGAPAAKTMTQPRVLFVKSEPGVLRDRYDFTDERALVQAHLEASETTWRELKNPTLAELAQAVADFMPDIVHLAGFDTHQAYDMLIQDGDVEEAARLVDAMDVRRRGEEIADGYVLSGDGDRLHPVPAIPLSRALNPHGRPPRLVSFNVWNSAARLAPIAVSYGVGAAIGFQDVFDEDLAETFFSCMYSDWRRAGWDLPFAFRSAWEEVLNRPGQMQGTGVVLWNSTPLFAAPAARSALIAGRHQHKLTRRLEKESGKAKFAPDVSPSDVSKYIAVHVKPLEDLNYSLLHNQRPLFQRFVLSRKTPQSLCDVRVRVALSAGAESAFFERSLTLDTAALDLRREIQVALTSALTRSVHESVRTSLYVEVRWGDHPLLQDTYPIRIVPVDQWRDTRDDRVWLPSFIFPRDPAIARLIDIAQRYLKVLRDDPAAGFDGYQGVDPRRPETAAETDVQVQAIWSAIVHDLRLSYINPPPGYSRELDSQRLRTPSMVSRDRCGTCIDLALFFAACLELVDIYPVIFLLEGHAFVGYWRSFEFHQAFARVRRETIEDLVSADAKTTSASGAQREPWFLGKTTYEEILRHVNAGRLVPLEAVRLTEACGFAEARDDGRENLRTQREFEALVDLAVAREAQVTPLPIWGEQA
jgi:hypothetical protein